MEGEGSLFYKNGIKKYDGNWENGKRNGLGISYYPSGKIEYNGTFLYDLYNGKGILYYYSADYNFSYDLVYEGDFNNNNMHMEICIIKNLI